MHPERKKSRGKGLSQCLPGRQRQYFWVYKHKIPSTANILWLNIFTVLPPYKPELDEDHWHKYVLPAPNRALLHFSYLGHTWEVLHCQQTKSLKLLSPAPNQNLQQFKGEFQGAQSERQLKSTLFSIRPVTKIIGLSR